MTSLGREYGDGLYELAREEHFLEEIHGQLMDIVLLLQEQPQFKQLLCSRAIERKTRIQVVEETFADRVHPFVVNFMKLLVDRERFFAFEDCVKWFHSRFIDELGIVEARVTTAVPLSEGWLEALRARLREISGKRVDLKLRVDPSLIGGVRVEMNGRRYDNTIQNRLDRLRHNLVNNL